MGTRRKYTREILAEAVAQSTSVAGVLRYLGLRQAGGMHSHISRSIRSFELDTAHFRRHQGGGQSRRLTADELLVHIDVGSRRTKPEQLTRALLERDVRYACALCANPGTWMERSLRLQVDHIDGDFHNNSQENIRFLCPNCHSQTDNFSGRGRGRFTDGSQMCHPSSP